jgi:hypothetical protein
MKQFPIIISLVSLFVSIFALYRSSEPDADIEPDGTSVEEHREKDHDDDHELEVAVYMDRLHRFSNKLYFAAASGHQETVDFYIHEMEEVMEELAEAGVEEDGFDISDNIQLFGIEGLKEFRESFASKGPEAVKEYHQALIVRCNACHQASGHGYLRMISPTGSGIQGQEMGQEEVDK